MGTLAASVLFLQAQPPGWCCRGFWDCAPGHLPAPAGDWDNRVPSWATDGAGEMEGEAGLGLGWEQQEAVTPTDSGVES